MLTYLAALYVFMTFIAICGSLMMHGSSTPSEYRQVVDIYQYRQLLPALRSSLNI